MSAKAFLLVLLLAPPALAQTDLTDMKSDMWMDHRVSKEEVLADRELQDILEKIKKGDLPKIQFDLNSARINEESYTTLDLIADLLLRNPRMKLRIEAHTCSIGSEKYNKRLSIRRAKSVSDYIVRQGVPPPSVRYKGYGEERPIADNSTEAGRVQNRRVEFHLLRGDWSSIY